MTDRKEEAGPQEKPALGGKNLIFIHNYAFKYAQGKAGMGDPLGRGMLGWSTKE